MTILTTQLKINVYPLFWKDTKEIYKSTKRKELKCVLEEEELSNSSDIVRLKSIPYTEAIINTICNKCPENLDDISDKYARQPFLNNGWIIRKMRYAIDNRGKSQGTRTIFCVNGDSVLMICIKLKNQCADERKFEAEFIRRIKDYLMI